MEVRFVSKNQHKLDEATVILGAVDIKVVPCKMEIEELQTTDTNKLVRDKLLKAYKRIGRPMFVEHTGLYLDRLEGLPGGLTQIFWDKLKAEKFSLLFGGNPHERAIARTVVAYCDGKTIKTHSGEIIGTIVAAPRGPEDFQWDCVFQPHDSDKTFAEMGEEQKNKISMRRLALDALAAHLKGIL